MPYKTPTARELQGPRKPWAKTKEVKRMTGRRLQKERERLFREQPLCEQCLRDGRYSIATIRDHIIPLAEGGLDLGENVQALCHECHDKKTAQEAARGRRG